MDYPSFNIDVENKYKFVELAESLKLNEYRHAAHCCIYSPHSYPVGHKGVSCRAYVSMQLRSDGSIGFPGGFTKNRGEVVSEIAEIIDNLNRELFEEVNLDEKYFATKEDYALTMLCEETKRVCHFFTKEVSIDDFVAFEKNAMDAEDYGSEVFGLLRVPLHLEADEMGGFPVFLSNNFVACSKYQLLYLLLQTKLMSYNEIGDYIERSKMKISLL